MNAAELANPETHSAVQRDMARLQKCLTALEKITSIAGPDSAIGQIASNALANKHWNAGGTDDGR